jgi:hypothetical protein
VTDYSKWQTVPIPVITETQLLETSGLPAEAPAAEQPESEPTRPAVPRWIVGVAALVFAVATIVVHIVGIVVASGGDWEAGTALGYVAIGTSILGFAVGVVAVVLGRGRVLGVVAVVLSILANPFVLLQVLNFFGGR